MCTGQMVSDRCCVFFFGIELFIVFSLLLLRSLDV